MLLREPPGKLMMQPRLDLMERINRDLLKCHAHEFRVVRRLQRLGFCAKHLVNRPVVASHVADKGIDEVAWKTKSLIHVHHIKDVSRMLPVHRGHQFASVQFRVVQGRQRKRREFNALSTGSPPLQTP